jgi:pimeloyl-ACP methyl ester carboxylesterase
MQRVSWLFSVTIISLLLPFLALGQQPTPPPATTADETTAAAERYQPDVIDWQPCPENPAVECGTLTLPVDYKQPQGESFELAVVRAKATDPSKHIGALFAHPGGHASGVDFILAGVGAPVFEKARRFFDIISLDPRGAGRTRPLDCGFDLPELPADQSDAALISYFDSYGRMVAEQCLDTDRDFVLSISGNNFARDIELFRRALGEGQLTFTMASNSGPVGAIYATLFPKRVRAMVLDSPVGPEFSGYWLHRRAEQSASLELSLHHIGQLCQRDTACRLHETGVVAAFDTLAARLKAAPHQLPDGSTFTADDLATAVTVALPIEGFWPLLVNALANALGDDYALLGQLLAFSSSSGNGFIARVCNDYGTRRSAAEYLPMDAANGTLYPRFFGRFWIAYNEALCSAWPVAPDTPVIRNVAGRVATPILLIGSEFDSDAPFAWVPRMANVLGMGKSVVRYAGGGHVLAPGGRVPCINAVFDSYIFELKLPAENTVCPARPISFAPRPQADSVQTLETTDGLWNMVEPLRLP